MYQVIIDAVKKTRQLIMILDNAERGWIHNLLNEFR